LALLLASLGIYVIGQNIISLIFGDSTQSFRTWDVREGLPVLGARITETQLVTVLAGIVLGFAVWLVLRMSGLGRQFRAVANSSELAKSVRIWAMAFAGLLGGIAGILMAADVDMTPQMGMPPLMLGVTAVILGGNTFGGTACGALLIGVLRNVSVIWIPSQWQDTITFAVLLVFLILCPTGFSTRSPRSVTV
jgi:branched-subunit amino acid ABC-type transport system permease component